MNAKTIDDPPLSFFSCSSELSALQDNEENMTDNFIQVNKVSCLQGAYPDHLLSEWDKYDKRKQSENDRPGSNLLRASLVVFVTFSVILG